VQGTRRAFPTTSRINLRKDHAMTTTTIFRHASDNTQSNAAAGATGRLAVVAAIILSFGIATGSLWGSEAAWLPLQVAFHIAVSNR
jgi:hypothetical protein